MGQKPDDWHAVPLCRLCHQDQHASGEATFWDAYERERGQTVEALIASLCEASPKSAEIARIKKEREGAA